MSNEYEEPFWSIDGPEPKRDKRSVLAFVKKLAEESAKGAVAFLPGGRKMTLSELYRHIDENDGEVRFVAKPRVSAEDRKKWGAYHAAIRMIEREKDA